MKPKLSAEFIRAIPKTDLHVHLDGSLRLSTLIELARKDNIQLPSYDEAGLKELVFKSHYQDLPDYLKGFAFTCAVMHNAENIERIAYELAQDNIAENVRYIEVRFAPQLHIREGFSLEAIVRAACQGLDRAKQEHNASDAVRRGDDIPFEYGLILCAMRCFNEHYSPYYANLFHVMRYSPQKEIFATASLELARAAEVLAHQHGLPVVGFDLAGEESGYPAVAHKAAYHYAHSHFIRKTVHAGEAYGPESIFQAITECFANRIGHGTFLFAADMIVDPDIENPEAFVNYLAEYIASQRIAIEVCPTSNLQTIPVINDVAYHPLKLMLEHNLSVTICTDNRLVSNTSVSDELALVSDSLKITPRQLRNLVLAGFKGSFFPGSYNDKRAYVRKVINRYDALEASMLK
ncbi:MAG: adenosine deaminase family protein [Kiritimatiellae bacterium]|nr:adenosine deaminase family protein [Kiritimatiellia bacterium]